MTEQEVLESLRRLDGPVQPDPDFRDRLYHRLQAERSGRDDVVASGASLAGRVASDMAEVSVTSKPSFTGRGWAVAAAAFLAVVLVGATTIWLAPGSEPEPPVLSFPGSPSTSVASSVPETAGSAEQAGGLVFSRPLPWTLVFDNGASHISILDLNHDEPRSIEVDGARGGDQPYRLTHHDDHLVVGWGDIYAFDTTTLESSLLGEATIHVPASAPSRVWMVEYPSGRIGSGPLEVWQVHVVGGQSTERQTLDVDGHPAHGIPGGLALESDSGVVLWHAETGDVVGTLGSGTGFVSDATVDGKLAWCENTCEEMRISSLSDGTEIAVSHPNGGAFEARAARFSDDGRYLAAPTATGVVLIDTTNGDSRVVITLPSEVESPFFVAWAPDSQVVFAASYSYGQSATTVGYYSVVSDTADVTRLSYGGTLSFVVLPTNEAGQLLGTDPVAEREDAPSLDCPVTIPERLFTPPAPYPPDPVHDDAVWYGTPELWTAINPKDPVRSETWLRGEKTFWWSENFPGGAMEGSPNITVTAGHLEGSAPVVKSGGPGTNGFHPDMGDFMLVGVELPAPGCWELTAEYKGASLSYVMWVPDR